VLHVHGTVPFNPIYVGLILYLCHP